MLSLNSNIIIEFCRNVLLESERRNECIQNILHLDELANGLKIISKET